MKKTRILITPSFHTPISSIAWVLLILLFSAPTLAAVSGHYEYANNGDGTCTITGYTGYDFDLIIPGSLGGLTVTTIGYAAFYDRLWTPDDVTIPDCVTTIASYAFGACRYLKSIHIGSGVTTIEEQAFAHCERLTDITVNPANPAFITQEGILFNKTQTKLIVYPVEKTEESYRIPDSVTTIEDGALAYCSHLKNITVSATHTVFTSQEGVLYNQAKTKLIQYPKGKSEDNYTIPNSVIAIGAYAFYQCTGLTGTLTIPDSVVKIGDSAFYQSYCLTGPEIGSSITSIGNSAFYNCVWLTSVTIPDTVTTIGNEAFAACGFLESITVDPNNPVYSSAQGILFDKTQTKLIQYPAAKAGNYTIADNVNTVSDKAFYKCYHLTGIIIGSGVTSIGDKAFYDCSYLTGIFCRGNAPYVGDDVFKDVTATVYYIPWTTGWAATLGELPTNQWPLSPADVEMHYEVNLGDFSVLAAHWSQTNCNASNNWRSHADFDHSGTVDLDDLILLTEDWLYGTMPF